MTDGNRWAHSLELVELKLLEAFDANTDDDDSFQELQAHFERVGDDTATAEFIAADPESAAVMMKATGMITSLSFGLYAARRMLKGSV
jgi:hypothetical protein